MSAGCVLERGVVNGRRYRVWCRHRDNKKFVYVTHQDGRDRRHNMKWLHKQKRLDGSQSSQ